MKITVLFFFIMEFMFEYKLVLLLSPGINATQRNIHAYFQIDKYELVQYLYLRLPIYHSRYF